MATKKNGHEKAQKAQRTSVPFAAICFGDSFIVPLAQGYRVRSRGGGDAALVWSAECEGRQVVAVGGARVPWEPRMTVRVQVRVDQLCAHNLAGCARSEAPSPQRLGVLLYCLRADRYVVAGSDDQGACPPALLAPAFRGLPLIVAPGETGGDEAGDCILDRCPARLIITSALATSMR